MFVINFWMSVNGFSLSMYYDFYYNFLCIVFGCKEVKFWLLLVVFFFYFLLIFGEVLNYSSVDFVNFDFVKYFRFFVVM